MLYLTTGCYIYLGSQDFTSLQISLLTCGQGDQLYSTFGHSAIRVHDPVLTYDVVYNWGTFDTSTSFFYLKFMRGKLPYYLSVASFDNFLREYKYYERSVVEQVLNLTNDQKRALVTILQENSREENKFYAYDFFYDNCSTRIRDVVDNSVGNIIQWEKNETNLTWRDQLHESLVAKPWSEFGIDLVIGSKADVMVDAEKQMFLPKFLFDYFDSALIQDTVKIELINSESIILAYDDKDKERNQRPLFTPHILFLILLIFELMVWWIYRLKDTPKWIKYWHKLIFLIAGAGSIIILFLWFLTDHQATRPNWNIIWVSPIFLIFPFVKNGILKLVLRSLLILGIGIALIHTLVPFLPQIFNYFNLGAYALLLFLVQEEKCFQ